jgi:hypothetical protein
MEGLRSGRAMARIGLRMMPTFPSPSLECRTVGFPQYGYKAGLSDGAFPCDINSSVAWFASILRALRCHRRFPRAVSRDAARLSTTVQAAYTALPQGPSLQPGFALQVFIAYLAPSAPLAISLQFPCLAGYMRRLRCAAILHDARPKLMTSGSRLSIANLS